MNLLKKITAVMAALLIVVNITVVNIFAAAAPVAAGGFILFLTALLAAGGHSQSDIDAMDVTQMQSVVSSDLRSGRIKPDTIVADPFTGENYEALDYLCYHEYYDFRNNTNAAINGFVSDLLSGYDYIFSEYVNPTIITSDSGGNGAYYIQYKSDGTPLYKIVADYLILDFSRDGYYQLGRYQSTTPRCQGYRYRDGEWIEDSIYGNSSGSIQTLGHDGTLLAGSSGYYKVFGDVRVIGRDDFETDDEFVYQLGEVDGTAITPDMLNPDGTVTIDGVTYYPADYLDPDNLTEEGKNALSNAIADAIDNTYVKAEEEDYPIVGEDDITVEVSEGLENFKVPIGIMNVFPFCLPRDFVRGMKLFSAKPVTPHFEVTIDVPAILNVPAQKWTLKIDLGKFETLAKITRWTSMIGFSYLLISLSTKIVKGAGA